MTSADDLLSLDGAMKLAKRVRAYWQRRGQEPDVRVELGVLELPPELEKTGNKRLFVVRSDMRDGLPNGATR